MRLSGLQFDQIPPLSFPFRFYLMAPFFAVLTALLLVSAGEQLWLSRWTPLALAITHLMALGVIAMIMFGSLFQLLPVLCGTPIALSSSQVTGFLCCFALGVLSLAAGFLSWLSFLIPLILLFISLIGFASYLAYTLWFKASGQFTRFPMLLAVFALAITIMLGLGLLVNYQTSWLGALPKHWTNVHALFGTFGWVSLLIIAVSFQVIPMFHVTPEFPLIVKRYLPLSIFTLLIVSAVEINLAGSYLSFASLLVLISSYALLGLHQLRLRKRKLPDTTIKFWQLGLSALLLLSLLMLVRLFIPVTAEIANSLEVLLGIIMVLGVILSVIQGMLLKIVPFLITLHLQQHAMNFPMGMELIPDHYALISRKLGIKLYWLHLATLLIAVVSVTYPSLIKAAGLMLMVNWTLLWLMIWRASTAFYRIKQAISNT